jgi:hypothetical protein
LPAIWLESALISGMMTVGIFLPELAWNIDFLWRLLTRKKLFGISDYMFDNTKPAYLRWLSLFHVPLPFVMIYLVYQLGYDEMSLPAMVILSWIILIITYIVSDPSENINWVFGPGKNPQKKLHALLYLLIVLIVFPLFIFIPTHFMLLWLFG